MLQLENLISITLEGCLATRNYILNSCLSWTLWRSIESVSLLTFKQQYPHTNSPNRSSYISCKKLLREFNKRSRHFLFGDHLAILITFSLDNVWILLGENWCWSLLGLKVLLCVSKKRVRECGSHSFWLCLTLIACFVLLLDSCLLWSVIHLKTMMMKETVWM